MCAADLARRRGDTPRAARYERTADRWAASVESWTATSNGPYSAQPYYLRITKDAKPNRGTTLHIGDGGPARADQRKVVDPSFLELVRLGVKRHDDPVILNTLQVVDQRLKVETPNGPFWHRFTYDGYGERANGGPWELSKEGSSTFGRVWPIFAGERGEYELLAAGPRGRTWRVAAAGNDGGMIPEQVWDGRPPTDVRGSAAGEGTFSATPLAWSHAQLVRLAWSIDAGARSSSPRSSRVATTAVPVARTRARARRRAILRRRPRAGAGFSFARQPLDHDLRSSPPWPVETSGSLSPSRARSASAGTTRPTSPSATTRIASPCASTAGGAGSHTGHRETR